MNFVSQEFYEREKAKATIGKQKAKMKSIEWEIERSSLAKINGSATYEECRKYACNDIAKNITYMSAELPFIIDIPKGAPFHFLVRVGTNKQFGDPNHPVCYYDQYQKREFVSYTPIWNENVSYYGLGGNILFAYNMPSEMISHIFPMDCDSDSQAKNESELTKFPSLWLTQKDLYEAILMLRTYGQITCKTKKKDGEIIRPCRIIAIDRLTQLHQQVAMRFGIGCTIIHPNNNAIRETFDPYVAYGEEELAKAIRCHDKLKAIYGLELK